MSNADRLISFLRAEGAGARGHAGERSLLDHLVGTYEIARRWDQPVELQLAALLHSVYGTDVYEKPLVAVERRPELIDLAGERAERLAYLFCAVPRDLLLAGTHRWARDVPVRAGAGAVGGPGDGGRSDGAAGGLPDRAATREELDALVLLHLANLAEQKGAREPWLVTFRHLAELLVDSESVRLPLFVALLADFTPEDELLLRRAYVAGLEQIDAPEMAAHQFGLAASVCPVVAEPCVWLAYIAGERDVARQWAGEAERRLVALGAAWDKRLSFEEWRDLARLLVRGCAMPAPSSAVADPRALLDAARSGGARAPGPPGAGAAGGRERFQRYMDGLGEAERPGALSIYPDLASRPWHDSADFPIARRLEEHFDEIREEILALDAGRFHSESERIGRSGDWDVVFLYERGRRHDDVCEACPVTARLVGDAGAMRTMAGLIYVSRMRRGTHIRAHRGPTNLRLRCHLGIDVPDGDCAIRVGDDARPWVEGRCLVFDDYVEHEAWNRTDEDRTVLIVDLWHPGLSRTEVRLLEGLHRYAYTYARQLGRYWAKNAAAAAA